VQLKMTDNNLRQTVVELHEVDVDNKHLQSELRERQTEVRYN